MIQSVEPDLAPTTIMVTERRGRTDAIGSAIGILQRTASSSSGELSVLEVKGAIWRLSCWKRRGGERAGTEDSTLCVYVCRRTYACGSLFPAAAPTAAAAKDRVDNVQAECAHEWTYPQSVKCVISLVVECCENTACVIVTFNLAVATMGDDDEMLIAEHMEVGCGI